MTSTLFFTRLPAHVALARGAEFHAGNPSLLAQPQFRHRAVMSLFPSVDSSTPRSELGVLFRLDHVPGQAPYFLIQSRVRPSVEVSGVDVKEAPLPHVPAGTTIRFRVAVNAVQRKGKKSVEEGTREGKATKVNSIPFDADATGELPGITEWLSAKLSPALTQVTILNHTRELLGKPRRKKGTTKGFVLQVDTIDGVAQVGDEYALQLAGVGREKSYGCGLLSVMPIA